jgi:AcrR family transcriptional regulator
MRQKKGNEASLIEGHVLRADAQRNHDLLVETASAAFAECGVDAPMKLIADRAGVGVGTLYRRFPKRSDLIVAVFRHEVEGCAYAADTLATEYPPFEALARWMDRYVALIVTKRGLAKALHSGEPAYEDLPAFFEGSLVPPLQGLLESADDDIRADILASELLRAVALLCAPSADGNLVQTRRMVALLMNGLRIAANSQSR